MNVADHPAPPPGGVLAVVSQLGRGGAERQTFQLLKGLAGTPWAPRAVVCLSEDVEPFGPPLREMGYSLEVVPRSGSVDLARLMALRRRIRSHRPRVVYAVHLLASAYASYAAVGAGPSRVLPSIRGSVIDRGGVRLLLYRRAFRRAPVVLANSHRGADVLKSQLGVRSERLIVVPNGIDFSRLPETPPDPRVRDAIGVDRRAPIVGFVGKNSRIKNVRRFLDAWEIIAARVPGARAILVGGGLSEVDRSGLGRIASADRVLFLGTRDDVPAILSCLDVLVLTSDSEGSPNVAVEALAVGVPVVSTDVGDVGRIVENGNSGWVAERPDPDRVAEHVVDVLHDSDGFRTRVRARRPHLEREFSLEAMVGGTVEAWDRASRG